MVLLGTLMCMSVFMISCDFYVQKIYSVFPVLKACVHLYSAYEKECFIAKARMTDRVCCAIWL